MYFKTLSRTIITLLLVGVLILLPTPILGCDTVEACDQQLDDIAKQKEDSKNNLDASLAQEDDLMSEIRILQQQIKLTEEQITVTEQNIQLLEAQIIDLEAKVAERTTEIAKRLVVQQKQSTQNLYLSMLISATSISDFIERMYAIETYNKYENSVIEELNADKLLLAESKTDLETKSTTLQQNKVELQEAETEAETLKTELRALISQQEAELDSLAASESDIARQRDILNQPPPGNPGGGGSTSNGSWTLPVASYATVTAYFKSPTYYYEYGSWHLGTDIWSPDRYGGSVYAAADGWVLGTGYYGALGNVIAIGHNINGTNYVSMYAHLQSISVSTGEYVYGGNYIGGIGSSGGNYAPHLHFELAYRDYFTTSRAVRDATNFDSLDVLPSGWYIAGDAW